MVILRSRLNRALKRQRQEDCCKCEIRWIYVESGRPVTRIHSQILSGQKIDSGDIPLNIVVSKFRELGIIPEKIIQD